MFSGTIYRGVGRVAMEVVKHPNQQERETGPPLGLPRHRKGTVAILKRDTSHGPAGRSRRMNDHFSLLLSSEPHEATG